jgi:tetratricopeptide (TPR) repeat protein
MRILVLALLVAVAAVAHADDQDLARAHFVTGTSYYDQARYGDALHEFEEAYRLSKRVGFLYNIGVCHEQLGHDDEAIAAYQGYLLSVSDEKERAEVQQRVDRLKAKKEAAAAAAKPAPATNAIVATSPPPARDKPVYKRGWFWGVMAGAAVVVVTGVAVGVVVGTRDNGPRTLADVRLQ